MGTSFGYAAAGENRTVDGVPLSIRPIPLGRPLDEIFRYGRYGRHAP